MLCCGQHMQGPAELGVLARQQREQVESEQSVCKPGRQAAEAQQASEADLGCAATNCRRKEPAVTSNGSRDFHCVPHGTLSLCLPEQPLPSSRTDTGCNAGFL